MDNDQLLLEIDNRLRAFKEEIAAVITGNAAELHTQIQADALRTTARFDAMDSQLKRIIESQVSSLQSTITFMEWAHRTDDGLLGLMKRVEVLERRLSNPGGAQ